MDFPRGGKDEEESNRISASYQLKSLFPQKRSAPPMVVKSEKRPNLGLVLDPALDAELIGECRMLSSAFLDEFAT